MWVINFKEFISSSKIKEKKRKMTGRIDFERRFNPKSPLIGSFFVLNSFFLTKNSLIMDYSMNFGETFVSLPKYMLEKDNIEAVVDILVDGGIICYPTDTVWGVGCDATNTDAIQKINTLKGRPTGKGYVLLVDSIQMLKNYIEELHPRIETLLEYHQRPLTIIYPKAKNLPAEVCGDNGSVAIRLTQCSFCKAVIKELNAPIVSTSANLAGVPFPKTFGEISSEIIENVDYIAKERRWDKTNGQPSTIAFVDDNGMLEFIRE